MAKLVSVRGMGLTLYLQHLHCVQIHDLLHKPLNIQIWVLLEPVEILISVKPLA